MTAGRPVLTRVEIHVRDSRGAKQRHACSMTDQASHGDASPECTRTPLVIWGAGVSHHPDAPAACLASSEQNSGYRIFSGRPRQGSADWREGVAGPFSRANSNVTWSMHSPWRTDVHQAQLAPLMAAVLGVAAPANIRFVLPDAVLAKDVKGMPDGAFPAQVPVVRLPGHQRDFDRDLSFVSHGQNCNLIFAAKFPAN